MHTQRTRAERPPHARGCPSSAASSGVRATRPPDGTRREMAPVGQGRGRGARGRRGWAFWKAACGTGTHGTRSEGGRTGRTRGGSCRETGIRSGPSELSPVGRAVQTRLPPRGSLRREEGPCGGVSGEGELGRQQSAHAPAVPRRLLRGPPPGALARGAPQLSLGPSLAVALGVPGDRGPASPPENHAGNATTRSGSRPGVLTRRRRSNMRRFRAVPTFAFSLERRPLRPLRPRSRCQLGGAAASGVPLSQHGLFAALRQPPRP